MQRLGAGWFCGVVLGLVFVFFTGASNVMAARKALPKPVVLAEGAYKLRPREVTVAPRPGLSADRSGFCLKHPGYCVGGRGRVVK